MWPKAIEYLQSHNTENVFPPGFLNHKNNQEHQLGYDSRQTCYKDKAICYMALILEKFIGLFYLGFHFLSQRNLSEFQEKSTHYLNL